MRAVVQRVSRAEVSVDGATVGRIGKGFLVLLGVGQNDTEAEAQKLWSKIFKMRIFEDDGGKTNLPLAGVDGEVLVVSQFTLYANCRRTPDEAERLYEHFVELASADIPNVQTGRFGAMMEVSLTNDGPFTICLDTDTL